MDDTQPEVDVDVNDLEGGAQGFFGIKEKIDIRPYIPLQPLTIYNALEQSQKEALEGWLPWIKAEKSYFENDKEVPKITSKDEIVLKLHKKWTDMNEQLKVYYTLDSKSKRPYTKRKPKPAETKKSSSTTTQSSKPQKRRSARSVKRMNYNEDNQTQINWKQAYCEFKKSLYENSNKITDSNRKQQLEDAIPSKLKTTTKFKVHD